MARNKTADRFPKDMSPANDPRFALPAPACRCERPGLVDEGRCVRCGKPVVTNNNGRDAARREQDR